jgi:hypothetical protein
MSVKFFLNSSGGSLAFRKEADVVSYPDTAWIQVDFGDTPTFVPTSSSIESSSQDVGVYRNGLLRVVCNNEAATWSILMYEGVVTGPSPGGEKMSKMLDSDISGTGTTTIPVEVFMIKYLWVQVVTLSAGSLFLEWAPAEWEEVE